jgi:hypothetical protein
MNIASGHQYRHLVNSISTHAPGAAQPSAILPDFTTDEEFSYSDHEQRPTTHLVRIFPNRSWVAVVVTDRSDRHDCPSITSSIDEFVPALLAAHPEISPSRLVVIEHYDHRSVNATLRSLDGAVLLEDDHFNLVRFGVEARSGRYCHPEWTSITKAEAEQWTGAPL